MTDADAGVDGGPAHARKWAPGSDPLARIVFALLVISCFAAFLLTQRLKHTPTAVQNFELTPVFSPYPGTHVKQEAISFKLAQADEVTVTIVDSDGDTVATLARDRPVARYKQFSLRWNGRRGSAHRYLQTTSPSGRTIVVVPLNQGTLSPPGEYRVRVSLRHQKREATSPKSFSLVRP